MNNNKQYKSQAWWFMPVIPAGGRLRLEDQKAILNYIVRPCLKIYVKTAAAATAKTQCEKLTIYQEQCKELLPLSPCNDLLR
jgi:hypothetical protein